VDYILSEYNETSLENLIKYKSLDIYENEINLLLMEYDRNNTLYKGSRIGLKDKGDKYYKIEYR